VPENKGWPHISASFSSSPSRLGIGVEAGAVVAGEDVGRDFEEFAIGGAAQQVAAVADPLEAGLDGAALAVAEFPPLAERGVDGGGGQDEGEDEAGFHDGKETEDGVGIVRPNSDAKAVFCSRRRLEEEPRGTRKRFLAPSQKSE